MTALEPDELTTKTPTDDNDLDDAAIPLGFSSPSTFHPFFESDEHRFLGDSCLITIDDGDPAPAGLHPLPLGTSATRLTYGQLMALGGDFYGDPKKPISDGGADAPTRFAAAVNLLYQEDKKSATVYKILRIMDEETAAVKKAIAAGEEPSKAYSELGLKLSKKWDSVTGGRYLELAKTNWDHFGKRAIQCYEIGHQLALEQAATAKQTGPVRYTELRQALVYNAFADHFLTDIFSAGHMRTPRKELSQATMFAKVGSVLSWFMHGEDNYFGLHVQNQNGDCWTAYGDAKLRDQVNKESLRIILAAVQGSLDDMREAFLTEKVPDRANWRAMRYLPNLDQLADYEHDVNNHAAMFVLRAADQKVLRRKHMTRPQDKEWIDDWDSATTVAKFLFAPTYPNPLSPFGP